MSSTRIIQLSDCHVSAAANADYRGINPRDELEKLLEVVADWKPDLVLVTGDLAEDGSREAYEYVHARVSGLGVPVHTLPGNHDEAGIQASVFASTSVDLPLEVTAGKWKLVLLNSARPGLIAGRLDKIQLSGLESALAQHPGPALVFLHHQPVPVGSNWIDRYALEAPEEFWCVIGNHENVAAVGWGHVHQVFEDNMNGVGALSAPSSAINSLVGQDRFTPDGLGAACRWFLGHDDGNLESGILRA